MYLSGVSRIYDVWNMDFVKHKFKYPAVIESLYKQFGILNSYTLESTFYAPFNPKNQYLQSQKRKPVEDDQQVKGSELIQVGYDFCSTLIAMINSKILKRKFILDTTNPLGAMIPGQGGNPLTQFLMNQNKAEERSSAAKEPKDHSAPKSFVTGIA